MFKKGIQSCYGIEIRIVDNNKYALFLCETLISGSYIEIIQQKSLNGTFSEILNAIPKKKPVSIAITGKGILFKSIPLPADSGSVSVIQKAFPAVDVQDIYAQEFIRGHLAHITITRRDRVDTLIEKLREASVQVVQISLGCVPIVHIISQFYSFEKQLVFNGHHIFFSQDNNIQSFGYEAHTEDTGNINFKSELLGKEYFLPYAMALQLLMDSKLEPVSLDHDTVNSVRYELLSNLKFKRNLRFLIFITFAVLLINTIVYIYLDTANTQLKSKVDSEAAFSNDNDRLKSKAAAEEKLLIELGWNKGLLYSVLVDKVVATIPSAIKLTAINTDNRKGEFTIDAPKLWVIGEARTFNDVNNWISILKKQSWSKNVQLQKCIPNDKAAYVFELIIFM